MNSSPGLIRRKKKETDDGDTKSPSALEELPIEVKRHMASFLSVRDLLKISETSKRVNKDLNIVVVSSTLTDRASQNKVFQTDDITQCFAAVIPNQEESQSHPTTFACDVETNQYMTGTIWVIEQDLPETQSPGILKRIRFRRGKSVAKTTVNSRTSGKVNLSFFPKTGKFYQLWVNTQDLFGDDSKLYLNNMMLHHVGLATKPSGHVAFQFPVRARPRVVTRTYAVR